MRVATLDLGTNTFLCLIVEGENGVIQRVVRDEAEVVRLGQGVDKSGEFHPEALRRARSCLERFRAIIDAEGDVARILGVATSAARDVANGAELFRIAQELNLPLKVISGDDEARYSYSGACADMLDDKHRLVIDVGGGSTEFILGRGRDLLFARSVDLGGVRLTERLISRQPVPPTEAQTLQRHVSEGLADVLGEIRKQSVDEAVAVAGTPSALAAAELGGFDAAKVDGYFIPLSKLEAWVEEFAVTSVEEKKSKYNLGGRADIIYAGVSILTTAIRSLGLPGFRVSVKGLRYGVALDLLSRP